MTRDVDPDGPVRAPRTPAPLLWGAGVVAAAVLWAGTSGTLASWTSAVIANDTNTVATGTAVVLGESSGSASCSSGSSPGNSATCSIINKYGGTATPLVPGASTSTDVTFTNQGKATGTTFRLAPGACSQTPTAGTGSPPATNLCTAASELTVAISCSPGATYTAGSAWTDLAYAAAVPPTTTRTHAAVAGDLGPGRQWTCRVTVALNANASLNSQAITVSQPLTWTLASA